MFKVINSKVMNSHQKILTSMMILGFSGIFFFFLDDKIWRQLVAINQSVFDQTIFLCLFGSFMFLGTCFVKEYNVKIIAGICLSIVLITVSLIWFVPTIRIYHTIYGILGGALGFFYSTIFYLGIYGFPSEMRKKVIAIVLFSSYLTKYVLNGLLTKFGLNIVFPIILLIFLFYALLNQRINRQEMTSPQSLVKHPFPLKLVVLFSLIIFISYFETFLVGNGTKFLALQNQENLIWLNQLIHLVIYFGFYFVSRKLSFPRILYTSIICTILAYVFSVLPLNTNIPICIFYNISDALGDIILLALVSEIAFKHGKRSSVFSILVLSVAAGIIFASYVGEIVNSKINGNYILFYGIFLLLFCSYLLILPYFSKYVDMDNLGNSLKAVTSQTAMFNHSLKNMVVQISCGIEILRKSQENINGRIQGALDIISDSVNQMMDIVKHINSNTEEIKIVKEPYNMEEIIDSVIDSIKLLVINKNINIIKTCDENTTIKCDKKRMKEALYNIVKNACEAIKGNEGEIKIEVIKARKKLICKISDNGKGIPSNQIENVFKPFYTTKKVENNNYGLGLTYCYIVVEQHGGTIEIKSEENIGTSITIIFPT